MPANVSSSVMRKSEPFGGPILHRPRVLGTRLGRSLNTGHPALLHHGDVLEQAADRQRAHAGGRACLRLGQAVGGDPKGRGAAGK